MVAGTISVVAKASVVVVVVVVVDGLKNDRDGGRGTLTVIDEPEAFAVEHEGVAMVSGKVYGAVVKNVEGPVWKETPPLEKEIPFTPP